MKGRASVFWGKGGLLDAKYGDDVGFPDIQLWPLGTWLRDFSAELGVGKQL